VIVRGDQRVRSASEMLDYPIGTQGSRTVYLRDVARVDVRRDRNGVANFVEVNPLPGVHPKNSDLVIMARAAGWTYEELIGSIMASAERRWRAA